MKRSGIETLPPEVKAWLDQCLVEGNFRGYQQLTDELNARGYNRSKSAVHRYGQALELRTQAVRDSTLAAIQIAKAAPDDIDVRSSANISMMQSEMFNMFMTMHELDATDPQDFDNRVKVVSKLSKAISELSRASVNQKKWQTEMQERIRNEERAKAAEAASSAAKASGVSEETITKIRQALGMLS